MSVRPLAWNNSAPSRRIFMKFNISVFFENRSRRFKLHQNLTRITDTLHGDLCTFMIISRWILRRMRGVFQTEIVGKINTLILCSITFVRKLRRLCDNFEKYGRARKAIDDYIIRRVRIACWITKATDTHTQNMQYCSSMATILKMNALQ
jgi:hypothetical protein